MGHEPPTVAIGLLAGPGRLKDMTSNILATGEFVVNLVSERNARAMNVTCIDAPPDVNELELAGLTPVSSNAIRPPRIAESPVSFECRVFASLMTGPQQTLVIGRVVGAHVDGAAVQDGDSCYIDTRALQLIARMHGSGWYARCSDLFQLDRPTWAAYEESRPALSSEARAGAPPPLSP